VPITDDADDEHPDGIDAAKQSQQLNPWLATLDTLHKPEGILIFNPHNRLR
jgi:hypothetical protein